ncbi:predicted protein [Aspergillus terreus NIH2624]|uniref:Uncharacterized protein n=1 Tax=Aspergillus terreus (strain NIH 2624 / FGSC A1156) TaxID=341663 RepID=Q0CLS6_ASPTN|nr:uncharacterized protein ATEG_05358 [Aspergillus terreus NIH2624]EAU34427.1 predicted protein [Aspergillus terreus NIH2624]
MTAIIKKLRRKRKLSSELHSRWGDMSITYPNEGSWSQCEVPPGAVSNAARGQSPMRSWPHGSAESLDRYNHSPPIHGVLRSASPEERHSSTDSAATIPTGYYDARVRGRSKRIPPPLGSTSGQRRHSHDSLRDDVLYPGDGTGSAPGGSRGDRLSDEKHHRRARDDADPYSRASRSPPLSVTSRMRRHSAQSSTTEPTPSMPNTASSKHTSLTSSLPSVPMEDIRPAPLAVYHEKKQPRRSKPREADAVVRQELVPSYEDLYG